MGQRLLGKLTVKFWDRDGDPLNRLQMTGTRKSHPRVCLPSPPPTPPSFFNIKIFFYQSEYLKTLEIHSNLALSLKRFHWLCHPRQGPYHRAEYKKFPAP